MIKSNTIYKVKCLNCGKHMEVQYKSDIKGDVRVSCGYCHKEILLYQNPFKRILNNLKIAKRTVERTKQSKWYNKYLTFEYHTTNILLIVLAIILTVFWIIEFRRGNVWIPIIFPR